MLNKLNVIALINVMLGLSFVIFVARKFGANNITDYYFSSLVLVSNICMLIRFFWGAIKQNYLDSKENFENIYSYLWGNSLFVSSLIIGLFYFFSNTFDVMTSGYKEILDILILNVFFLNILNLNKVLISLEGLYSYVYLMDTVVFASNLIALICYSDIDLVNVVITNVIITIILAMLTTVVVLKINKAKVALKFGFDVKVKELTIQSFKLNLGGYLYGCKDLFLITVMTAAGSGMYTLYSYSTKCVGVILQVINAPVNMQFTTRVAKWVHSSKHVEIWRNSRGTSFKLSVLFIVSSLIGLNILPGLVSLISIGSDFTKNQVKDMQQIFALISVLYLIVTFEMAYTIAVNMFKEYDFGLKVNITYFVGMIISYVFWLILGLEYYYFILLLICIQIKNAASYYNKLKSIQSENSILKANE